MPNLFITLLLFIIIILSLLLFRQISNSKRHQKELCKITQDLSSILEKNSSEKLMLFTEDKSLIALLEELNQLLNYNQKIRANHAHMELSMRKMLSNISHDLKTPLTVIVGYLETISTETSLSPEIQAKVQKSYTKALELQALIQEFFSLSKLESGDEQYPLSKINLNEICRQAILQFYESLSEMDWQVEIQIPEEIVYGIANETALNRILNNLISNALKYGSAGKTLGLCLRADDFFSYIDIWDKGKGIDVIHQEKVFERLYTLEDSRNRLYQGSGLGLTISRRLANVMHGDISVESKAFEKTTFTVKLKK